MKLKKATAFILRGSIISAALREMISVEKLWDIYLTPSSL